MSNRAGFSKDKWPPSNAPDEAVFNWPDAWIKGLLQGPANGPEWVARMPKRESAAKFWVAMLRRHESLLSSKVAGYDNVRDLVRSRVLLAADREARARPVLNVLVVMMYLVKGIPGGWIVAGLGPPLLFGYHGSWLAFLGDAACGTLMLGMIPTVLHRRLFNSRYLLSKLGIPRRGGYAVAQGIAVLAITGGRVLAGHGTNVVQGVFVREFIAFAMVSAWTAIIMFLEWTSLRLRRGPDPFLVLTIGLLSSLDRAVDLQKGRAQARQELLDELEYAARCAEDVSLGQFGVVPASSDTTLRAWAKEWGHTVAGRLRLHKRLVVQGGRRDTDRLVTVLATDFVSACCDDWAAWKIRLPNQPSTWPLVAASATSAALAVGIGVVTNIVTAKPTMALGVVLVVFGIASVVLQAWQTARGMRATTQSASDGSEGPVDQRPG
jgi:hypothetical protein